MMPATSVQAGRADMLFRLLNIGDLRLAIWTVMAPMTRSRPANSVPDLNVLHYSCLSYSTSSNGPI